MTTLKNITLHEHQYPKYMELRVSFSNNKHCMINIKRGMSPNELAGQLYNLAKIIIDEHKGE